MIFGGGASARGEEKLMGDMTRKNIKKYNIWDAEDVDFEGFKVEESQTLFRDTAVTEEDVGEWLQVDANNHGYGSLTKDEIVTGVIRSHEEKYEEEEVEQVPITSLRENLWEMQAVALDELQKWTKLSIRLGTTSQGPCSSPQVS
ncbi:hypothetical protein Hamer_G016021 [Homarus americanus]|uniref:Uncharacterized protein n=1 Tax=Homarus americanus TaxID=6706 RepID=A0A8J5MLD1_HOMAM|nr:hypothetical protein Hamer_G016021 [Homarus americanus]